MIVSVVDVLKFKYLHYVQTYPHFLEMYTAIQCTQSSASYHARCPISRPAPYLLRPPICPSFVGDGSNAL